MTQWLLYSVLGSFVTLMLHFVAGLSFGISAFAAFVGWPLVGTLVTFDDDLPGGWSNPDGTVTPEWRTSLFWGRLAVGLAVALCVSSFDVGLFTSTGIVFGCLGLAAALLSFGLLRRHFRFNPPVG